MNEFFCLLFKIVDFILTKTHELSAQQVKHVSTLFLTALYFISKSEQDLLISLYNTWYKLSSSSEERGKSWIFPCSLRLREVLLSLLVPRISRRHFYRVVFFRVTYDYLIAWKISKSVRRINILIIGLKGSLIFVSIDLQIFPSKKYCHLIKFCLF